MLTAKGSFEYDVSILGDLQTMTNDGVEEGWEFMK